MQTECLVESTDGRHWCKSPFAFFTRWRERSGRSSPKQPSIPRDADSKPVQELRVDGRLYQTWQEAVERTVALAPQSIKTFAERSFELPFTFPSSCTSEPICDDAGRVVGMMTRRQEELQGRVEIGATSIDAKVFKLSVRSSTKREFLSSELASPDAVIMRTFASTHAVLSAARRRVPVAARSSAGIHRSGRHLPACREPTRSWWETRSSASATRCWPRRSSFMITRGLRRKVPGDLFDGTEIDEILDPSRHGDDRRREVRDAAGR